MAQIKHTIELLGNIFKENGATQVHAEIFRLAKFNDVQAAVPMIRLLFELLYYLEFRMIDEVCVKAFADMSSEEICVYVKNEMAKKGFHSRDFASIPNDMSGGSREVLLGIGWLLCKQNVVSLFMNNVTSPLDEDTTNLYEEEGSAAFDCLRKVPLSTPADPGLRVQQLLWINNKLQLSLRNLYALQREKNVLQHRLHEATYGLSTSQERNHLSMFEVYMLRHPDLLKKNIQLLEQDNDRLTHLLKWKESEDVFWKWMESVLDEKVKQRGLLEQGPFPVPAESVSALQDSYADLVEAISKYEEIVQHLEQMWREKSENVSIEDLDSVITSIEMELSMQKANIALNTCESYIHHNQQPRFLYQRPQSANKPKRLPFSPEAGDSANGYCMENIRDIEEEIRGLHGLVDDLQLEVEDKQNQFKQEMQSLSNRFTNAVCIPPMEKKTYNI